MMVVAFFPIRVGTLLCGISTTSVSLFAAVAAAAAAAIAAAAEEVGAVGAEAGGLARFVPGKRPGAVGWTPTPGAAGVVG